MWTRLLPRTPMALAASASGRRYWRAGAHAPQGTGHTFPNRCIHSIAPFFTEVHERNGDSIARDAAQCTARTAAAAAAAGSDAAPVIGRGRRALTNPQSHVAT
jgi:hypothetical protein